MRVLDAAVFPLLRDRGVGVTPQFGGRWTVAGELTVRVVMRPVALEGSFIGAIVDPSNHVRLAFQASAAISRKEFGLTAALERESGGFLLGHDLRIEIHAEAIGQAETGQ